MKRLLVILFCFLLLSGCSQEPPKTTSQPARTPITVVSTPQPARKTVTVTPAPAVFDPADIPTFSVDSSCFSRVGYDASHETLLVCFRDSGAYYCYYDFTQVDYDDFIAADSLGSYYNKYIKGYYECEKLTD